MTTKKSAAKKSKKVIAAKKNIQGVLDGILNSFETGNIVDAVAMASFPMSNVPSKAWSFRNRTLQAISNSTDCRGFKQWKDVGRYVKKGSKAVYILTPCFKKVDKDKELENTDNKVISFFKATPVFRYEDTEGDAIEHINIDLPELPLFKKAQDWNILVEATEGSLNYLGYFNQDANKIVLASPEESVFFHELAHAAHARVRKNSPLKGGQDPLQEIVAELSAQALCRLVGKTADKSAGNSYKYIKNYASKLNLSAHSACMKVLKETEQVLTLILS